MTSDADAERSVVEVIRAVEALDLAEGTKTATEREDRLAVEERGGVGVEMRYIALTIVVSPEGCCLRALSILEDRQGTCPLDLLACSVEVAQRPAASSRIDALVFIGRMRYFLTKALV